MPKGPPNNPIDVHVGNRIRLQRVTMQLSQGKLGKGVGVTFQQIQKYEDGRNRVAAGKLFEIAQYLGVPISYFYDDMSNEKAGGNGKALEHVEEQHRLTEFLATAQGYKLCAAFLRIKNSNMRKRVLDLVTSMANGDE